MSGIDPREIFLQEAQDLLAQLEATLLDLEHTPADGDLIDTAFRALHTIKGSGSMFGFDAVAAFTHHVETAFDQVRQGKVGASRELIRLTLQAQDHMRRLIENPEWADTHAGDEILAAFHRLLEGTAAPAAPHAATPPVAAAAPAAPQVASWRIHLRFPRDVMANGTNPLLLIDELRTLGAVTVTALTDDVPSLEQIDPSACYVGWNVVLATSHPRWAIEDVFLFVRDASIVEIQPLEDTAPAVQPAAEPEGFGLFDDAAPAVASAAEPEGFGFFDDEPAAAVPEMPAQLAPPAPVAQPAPAVQHAKPAPSPEPTGAAAGEPRQAKRDANAQANASIRVPAERLDELMDRVGELVIAQSRLKQITAASDDPQIQSVVEEIERLARELQDTTMGVRMVPVGSLFGRFRRLVHDLSASLGKQIELSTSGEETELDKTVIDRLADPLVHLIRNCADHGLEQPADRVAAGKPAEGRISLTARHVGAEVHLTVSDDGRGLDRVRIQARAEERGLLAPGAKLSDEELYRVIFEPGFSTAQAVTNLSGRGVGMDVVKRTIEDLRGKIDVRSKPGHGSDVTLRLPLTLAIIDGLLVRIGRGRYVIPLVAVEECVELTPEDDLRSTGRSFLSIRDELVPFIRLRQVFRTQTEPDPYQKVVIVSAGGARVGLVVDQVIGDHQTVIKSLSQLHADVATFSGATILGDGSVALILDVSQLVESGRAQDLHLKAAS